VSLPKLNLLVAHDDDDLRRQICEAVEPPHRVTRSCASVAEVVEAGVCDRPDLVVLGIEFPDGSGIDATLELSRNQPVPAVIVTTDGSDEAIERAMEDHIMAYVVAPFVTDDLLASVTLAYRRFEEFRNLHEQVDSLQEALRQRKVIERAKGVLMANDGVDEGEAFNRLRRRAQDERQRLVEAAQAVLDEAGKS